MTITALKLITGEELIADLKSTISNQDNVAVSYVLRKPHILQLRNVQGGLGLAFVPFTMSNPDIETITLPASSVLVTFAPSAKVEEQFVQQTSSIQIARTM